MYKFLQNNVIAFFFSISVLVLLSAYFIEFVLGYEACNLCLIGRIPYFLVIILSLFFFFFKKLKKLLLIIIFMSFMSGVLIAFYHFGVEQGFFEESLVCQIKSLKQKAKQRMNELEKVKMLQRFKHLTFIEKLVVICRGIKVLVKKRIANAFRR